MIVKKADLTSYPIDYFVHQLDKELTLGDLHGNTLKLLYFLIQHGVVDLPDRMRGLNKQDLYAQLVKIYNTPPESIQKKEIDFFAEVIANLQIKNRNAIRLIGDELADRGMYDPFTLLLFKKLNQKKIPLTILASNHGFEFYLAYRKVKDELEGKSPGKAPAKFVPTTLFSDQARSLDNIDGLVQRNLITQQDVIKLYEQNYLANLKLIDYAFDEKNKTFTLFTHAVSGLTTIKNAAVQFGIEYKGETIAELMQTIDLINDTFVTKSQDGSLPIDFFNPHYAEDDHEQTYVKMAYPFARIIWNRTYPEGEDLMPSELDGYSLHYVHGHNGSTPVPDEKLVTNLDEVNLFGRPYYDQAPYAIYAQTVSRPVLEDRDEVEQQPPETLPISKELSEELVNKLLDVFKALELLLDKIESELDRLIAERKQKSFGSSSNFFPDKDSGAEQARENSPHHRKHLNQGK